MFDGIYIYKKDVLCYSTASLNPLLYNAVKGFIDIASTNYDDCPSSVVYADTTIRILVRDDIIIFTLNKEEENLEKIYKDYMAGELVDAQNISL